MTKPSATFTAADWVMIQRLVARLEKAPPRSSEKKQIRAGLRALGFMASAFGLSGTTRADMQRLLDEGAVRLIG